MFDGPAMLDAMRRDANAKLAAGDDETERQALSELEQWKARAPAGGCASSVMVKHWTYFQLHINPYLPQPMAGRVLSDMEPVDALPRKAGSREVRIRPPFVAISSVPSNLRCFRGFWDMML